jgi:hypothetical protein
MVSLSRDSTEQLTVGVDCFTILRKFGGRERGRERMIMYERRRRRETLYESEREKENA